MGCDIHSIGQVRKNNDWITKVFEPGGDSRNYDSFAVLANVRNGSGFAGVKTGEGWPVIAEPRGLPAGLVTDVDHYLRVEETPEGGDTSYWLGDHSHSWLTLAEIEDFIETRLKTMDYQRVGVVDRQTWQAMHDGKLKEPESWSGWISGGGIKVVSQEEAEKGTPSSHVQVKWTVRAMDCLYMLTKCVEALRELAAAEKVPATDVRLVFGFDS